MTDAEPGTYALLIRLDKQEKITIGKLGTFNFPAGYYLYVGGALGPGGLWARLARHRRDSENLPGSSSSQRGKKLHWHIDYLLQAGATGRSVECCLRREAGVQME